MRQSNIFFVALNCLFSHKRTWVFGAIYICMTLICFLLLAKAIDNPFQGIFDLLVEISGAWGSTNQNMLIIVAIPFIVTMINQLIERLEKSAFIIKSQSRFRTWHTHVFSVIALSFIFTCFILFFSYIVGGLFVGYQNTWLSNKGTIGQIVDNEERFQLLISHLTTFRIVFVLFITKFLVCLMISFLTLFIRQFIKNGALTMIILIAIAGIDYYVRLPFPIFTRAAGLSLMDWVTPTITVYHSVYLIIVTLFLYGITGLLYERKDFLS